MKYISTRGKAPVLNFEEAMLTGLARDGGLYVPQSIPNFSPDDISSMSDLSYEEIAFKVISPFVGDCFSDDELIKIINKAYTKFGHIERAPLVELENNHFLLELFHGPTLAFKDFAMQLIGQFFQVALERKKSRVTIVGATSGDTGSAAIEAFRGLDAVDVFILYPDGRVSDVQRRQMTTPSENNVHAMWMGIDNMPYYSYSQDEGNTWSNAMMIAPPIDLVGTGFPVVTAGAGGKVAFGYVGDTGNDSWNGYLTIATDVFSENPLFTTVQINDDDDPLDTTADCGYNRCGGLGDFLDMSVDQYGRPWFGLAHNSAGDIGIFATITEGPVLRGIHGPLMAMPIGGPDTLPVSYTHLTLPTKA